RHRASCPTKSRQSEWFGGAFGLTYHDIPFLDLLQKAKEHWLRIEPTIVPEAVLIEVSLQVIATHRMIDTADSTLYKAPKSLNGIRVDLASNVDSLAVIDPVMRVSTSAKTVVGAEVVSKDSGLREHM